MGTWYGYGQAEKICTNQSKLAGYIILFFIIIGPNLTYHVPDKWRAHQTAADGVSWCYLLTWCYLPTLSGPCTLTALSNYLTISTAAVCYYSAVYQLYLPDEARGLDGEMAAYRRGSLRVCGR